MAQLDDTGVSGRVPTLDRAVGDDGEFDPDTAFRILADHRRRIVLYLLVERGGTVPVDELAACVTGAAPEESSDGLPDRAQRRLYHNHLPRLAESGVVDYHRDAETVSLTDRGEELKPYLAFTKPRERRDVEAVLDPEEG